MSNIFNPEEEKQSKIVSNIKIIKIFAIILGILIIVGLIALFIGLSRNYKKTEENNKSKIYSISEKTERLVKFDFFQPNDAQLISASLGAGNEILLRYLYKGNNVLVILDKKTKQKKIIITLKKELKIW
jgi:flagellar basal body-associated protein FliL